MKRYEILKDHRSTKFKIKSKSYLESALPLGQLSSVLLALEEPVGQAGGRIWIFSLEHIWGR